MTEFRISRLPHGRHELAHRENGGIEVALYWNVRDNSTTIEVWHGEAGVELAFPVDPEHALDAFYHPFAHVPPTRDDATLGLAS